MKFKAYIHSLKDNEHDRHVLGEAEIIRQIGDNPYSSPSVLPVDYTKSLNQEVGG